MVSSRFLQGVFPCLCSKKTAAYKHMTDDIIEILVGSIHAIPALIDLVKCFLPKEKTTIINKKKKKKKKKNKDKN